MRIRDWISDVCSSDLHNPDRAHRRETAVVEQEAASIEGMHRLDGQIYKVQVAVHGSGREYAKVLLTEQTGTCGGCEKCDGADRCPVYASRFEYAAGLVRRLSVAPRLALRGIGIASRWERGCK